MTYILCLVPLASIVAFWISSIRWLRYFIWLPAMMLVLLVVYIYLSSTCDGSGIFSPWTECREAFLISFAQDMAGLLFLNILAAGLMFPALIGLLIYDNIQRYKG